MASRRRKTTPTRPGVLPAKPYFKIGEVAGIVGVAPSVLRYWETEFAQVRPEKSRTNQRVYDRASVERLLAIRTLLYDDGHTIAGARRKLREPGTVDDALDKVADKVLTSPTATTDPRLGKAADLLRELLQLCDE
jgi:DNA-binding transcriptional MerR regulator